MINHLLECSPLGEPKRCFLSFPANQGNADKKYRVKLKLDTPAELFQFDFYDLPH
jgi:hypothetical protein